MLKVSYIFLICSETNSAKNNTNLFNCLSSYLNTCIFLNESSILFFRAGFIINELIQRFVLSFIPTPDKATP